MSEATQACKDAYKAWCHAKGIAYKDPEKFASERSLAAAITSAQRGSGRRYTTRGQGNGFRSRGRVSNALRKKKKNSFLDINDC